MLPRFIVSLVLFSFACGVGVSVWGASVCLAQDISPSKKPTPTPTPPNGGPDTSNPGGPSRANKAAWTGADTGGRPAGVMPSSSQRTDRTRASVGDAVGFDGTLFNNANRGVRSYRARRPLVLYSRVCDPTEHTQEDLTGTYSGNIEYPSRNISGSATLDIKGRRFTLTANGVDLTGDISSVTTCDYTAVAVRFVTPASSETGANAAESISLKAQRLGSALMLTSVEGQTRFEFTPPAPVTVRPRRRR
jgi:hypothetical protein